MYYFGTNLDQRFSVPDFWPAKEATNQIPFEREEITEELARLRAKRLEARARRLALEQREAGAGVGAGEEVLVGGERGVGAIEGAVREGVLAENTGKGRSGESVLLKTLGNAREIEARASGPGEEMRQQGGKSWFKIW